MHLLIVSGHRLLGYSTFSLHCPVCPGSPGMSRGVAYDSRIHLRTTRSIHVAVFYGGRFQPSVDGWCWEWCIHEYRHQYSPTAVPVWHRNTTHHTLSATVRVWESQWESRSESDSGVVHTPRDASGLRKGPSGRQYFKSHGSRCVLYPSFIVEHRLLYSIYQVYYRTTIPGCVILRAIG